MSTFNNTIVGAVITGSTEADSILNTAAQVKINALDGKDTIDNSGENVTVLGGDGKDTVTNSGSDVIVTVGDGSITLKDAASLGTLNIAGEEVATVDPLLIVGTDGADNINNSLEGATIQALGGADSVYNRGDSVSVDGGTGNDTIINRGNLATILGGAGDDYVKMSDNGGKAGVYVYTGGNDTVIADYWALNTIVLDGVSVESSVRADDEHGTFYLSNGKTLDVYPEVFTGWHVRVVSSMNEVPRVISVIDSGDSFVSLTGANQKGTIDLIHNWGGDKVTITGDKSDYRILNTGTYGKITTGTGNDTIFNWGGNNSTISTGTGDDDISNSASNVSINSGTGNDFIEIRDGISNVTVDAGDGDDSIYDEWGESNSLLGGAGNDTFNPGKNSTVYAGSGDDRVDHPNYGGKVFLEDGNDLFYAYGETIHDGGTMLRSDDYFVDGGAGDDNFIINGGTNATINGGTGDDFIRNNGGKNLLVTYTEGDGNDLIYGFRADSTLQIGGGTGTYSKETVGDDIVVTVGDGSVTLEGAATLESVHINNDTVTPVNPLLIVGTEGADNITNSLNGATIQALGGNDTIDNRGVYSVIDGGAGNDSINNRGDNGAGNYNTIDGGAGSDTIENSGNNVSINGGTGDDSIWTSSNNNTTDGGAGNDTIGNWGVGDGGNRATINGGAGDDSIANHDHREDVSINGGDGADTIYNSGDHVTLDGGAGHDSIWNNGLNVTINGGDGDDTIEHWWSDSNNSSIDNVVIDGGDGNNHIVNQCRSHVTIKAGAGNDYVYNGNGVYNAGGVNVLIETGDGDDQVNNNGSYSTVNTGAGNDSIHAGSNSTIDAGAGDDAIVSGKNSVIFLGEGNDTYDGSAATVENNFIDGGDGDDTFILHGNSEGVPHNLTINGGAGNDSIHNDNGENLLVTYNDGDGNDIIYGFRADSTLQIGDGTGTYSKETVGNDVIVTVGEGKITLRGAASLGTLNIAGEEVATVDPLDIVGTEGADNISNSLDGATIQALGGKDTITNSGTGVTVAALGENDKVVNKGAKSSISGGADNDTLTNTASTVTLAGGTGDDLISLSSGAKNNLIEYAPGDGNDTVRGFSKDDTLQIDGGLGEYSTLVSGSDIIVNVGTGSINLRGATSLSAVNINGIYDDEEEGLMTVNRTAGKLSGTDYEDVIFNYANKVTVTAGAGEDLLATMRKTSDVKLYGEDDNDTLEAYNASKVLLDGGDGNDDIYSSGKQNTIVGGTGDDAIEIDSTSTQIKYAAGDGNDIIEGFNEDDSLIIGDGKGTYTKAISGSDVVVTVGEGKITLTGAASLVTAEQLNIEGEEIIDIVTLDNKTATPYTVVDGIVTVDAASKRTKAIEIIGNALDNSIVGSAKNDTIYGQGGSDTIDGGAGADRLYGGDGDDYVTGGAGSDRIYGNDGDDTLAGGTGNDSLWGGDGEDTFVYSGGKDVIKDYTAGEDVIFLESASFSNIKQEVSGFNMILGFSTNNSLTIENASNAKIMLVDADGNDTLIVPDDPIVILTNSDKTPYTVADGITIVDAASKRTKAIKITGNASDNSIVGSSGKDTLYGQEGADIIDGGKGTDRLYGGDGDDYISGGDGSDRIYGDDGDDTLAGGAGNDSYWGGAGEDTFVYTGGKDVIKDYTAGEDVISLEAATFSDDMVSFKDENVILTISTNNVITIEGAVGSNVVGIDKDGNDFSIGVDTISVLDDSNSATYKADDGVIVIDASARSKKINITGNDLDNEILGGSGIDTLSGEEGADYLNGGAGTDKLYGGDGDDTLYGGAGNDTLWGGEGSDVFVYNSGDGKDTVFDFDEDDMLQITGTFTGTYNIGTNTVAFKVASTSKAITLQDFTTSTFNVNGDNYVIQGTKLVKQ